MKKVKKKKKVVKVKPPTISSLKREVRVLRLELKTLQARLANYTEPDTVASASVGAVHE